MLEDSFSWNLAESLSGGTRGSLTPTFPMNCTSLVVPVHERKGREGGREGVQCLCHMGRKRAGCPRVHHKYVKQLTRDGKSLPRVQPRAFHVYSHAHKQRRLSLSCVGLGFLWLCCAVIISPYSSSHIPSAQYFPVSFEP